jgi:glycine/D-amino acid oxidase-like deaminating enzyme
MQKVDYIIVGQGLAGTLLGHFLEEAGQRVLLIDPNHQGAASCVAAGIINPITGRRYVKSWKIDDLFPFATTTYQRIEQQLDISFFHPSSVLRTLFNHRELHDWEERQLSEHYQKYMPEQVDIGSYEEHTIPAYAYGEVHPAAQVEVEKLVKAYRQFWEKSSQIFSESFDFEQLQLTDTQVQYKNITAKTVIFCEGAKAKQNPFFNYLPFKGNKGEALIVRIPKVNFQKLLKQRVFIVPLSEKDTYWIGATNEHQHENDLPSESGKTYMLDRLRDVLKVPFEVVQHKAAIRPTVRDRRPFLGRHPAYEQLAIFNGLGTKGASLGPYFAHQMTQLLLTNTAPSPEVDIQRFKSA